MQDDAKLGLMGGQQYGAGSQYTPPNWASNMGQQPANPGTGGQQSMDGFLGSAGFATVQPPPPAAYQTNPYQITPTGQTVADSNRVGGGFPTMRPTGQTVADSNMVGGPQSASGLFASQGFGPGSEQMQYFANMSVPQGGKQKPPPGPNEMRRPTMPARPTVPYGGPIDPTGAIPVSKMPDNTWAGMRQTRSTPSGWTPPSPFKGSYSPVQDSQNNPPPSYMQRSSPPSWSDGQAGTGTGQQQQWMMGAPSIPDSQDNTPPTWNPGTPPPSQQMPNYLSSSYLGDNFSKMLQGFGGLQGGSRSDQALRSARLADMARQFGRNGMSQALQNAGDPLTDADRAKYGYKSPGDWMADAKAYYDAGGEGAYYPGVSTIKNQTPPGDLPADYTSTGDFPSWLAQMIANPGDKNAAVELPKYLSEINSRFGLNAPTTRGGDWSAYRDQLAYYNPDIQAFLKQQYGNDFTPFDNWGEYGNESPYV